MKRTVGLTAGLTLVMSAVIVAPGSAGAAPAVVAAPSGKAAPAPAKTQITYNLGLARPEQAAVKAFRAVSDPTSPQYRRFLDRDTVASKYGATAKTIATARRIVGKYGLHLAVDPSGVFASVSGPARGFNRMMGAPVMRIPLPPASGGTGSVFQTQPQQTPAMRELGAVADQVIPFQIKIHYFPLQLSAVAQLFASDPRTTPDVNKGTPDSCLSESPTLNEITYSYNQLRTAYGIDQLPAGSDVGANTRLGIMALGTGFADDGLQRSKECFDLPDVSFTRVAVPGTKGALPEGAGGGGEGDLDVQIAQAMLPEGSQVQVIESSTHEFNLQFLSWAAAFRLPTLPDVLTASYGQCERLAQEVGGGDAVAITDSVLLRLGLAGVTTFSASGDYGSSGCYEQTQQTTQAANYPASSLYVTGVGGTDLTLSADNTRANEIVWNQDKDPAPFRSQAGGGGATSDLFARPWWQPQAATKSEKRAVPDLSAHASQMPGWPLAQGNSITPVSGTSAATPMVASAFAIMAAQERINGRPSMGPVSPLLYRLHDTAPVTLFDVVEGNNDVFGIGCCTARKGYDEASGLGAPALNEIYANLPAPGGS